MTQTLESLLSILQKLDNARYSAIQDGFYDLSNRYAHQMSNLLDIALVILSETESDNFIRVYGDCVYSD